MNLYVGQKLECLNGEYVTIIKIFEDIIIVKYRDRLYSRLKDIVGQKLFIIENDISTYTVIEPSRETEPSNKEYTCNDCMLSKRGDCFGQKNLCNHFKACPRISKSEIDSWPKFMLGPYGRDND